MQDNRSRTARGLLPFLVMALVLATVPAVVGAQTPSDTLSIVKEGEEGLSNSEIASRLTDETFTTADRVLIGRDDEFADAMTSGLLQADSPLLLVPRSGPVPDRVKAQLTELAPTEVLLLGGEAAIEPAVADELADLGYDVVRAFGPSRFETATAVADLGAEGADTVLIARGFAADGASDPTQAFADALAAGGWAAANRWPILLTQTEVLTGATRRWLADRQIDTAFVLGGTAAVSESVVTELAGLVGTVERVAGGDRFGTATQIADNRCAASAADVERVSRVEGQDPDAWAGGFAAAGHSAAFDAPIVLANGGDLPDATEDWLTEGSAWATTRQGGPSPVLTCVTVPQACERARVLLGLPAAATIDIDPPDGSQVDTGDPVTITVTGDIATLAAGGGCLAGPASTTASALTVQVASRTDCVLQVVVTLPGGATQTAQAAYVVQAPPPPATQILLLTADDATDRTTGHLRLVGADGVNPRIAAVCDGCEELRVAPDGGRAVVERDGSLLLVDGPDFAQPTVLVPAQTSVSYRDAQFTPDGAAVVATRSTAGAGAVPVRIALDGSVTPLTQFSAVLAGFDAVGPTPVFASGTGAIVLTSVVGFAGSSTGLSLVDVAGAEPAVPLTTTTGFVTAAALSPDGLRYAYGLDGQQVVVGDTTMQRTTRATSPNDPINVSDPVWLATTVVGGVDTGPSGPRHVSIDVTADPLSAAGLGVVAGMTAPGRPDPVPGGLVLAAVGDRLVRSDGVPIAAFAGTGITNPHLLD